MLCIVEKLLIPTLTMLHCEDNISFPTIIHSLIHSFDGNSLVDVQSMMMMAVILVES